MSAEDRFIADGEHLNCPHCGGSGHIDDIQVSEEMVERAAEALWNAQSHKLLEKAGYTTSWQSQPKVLKLDKRKQARAALTAVLKGEK